jgi:ribosomal protein L1
VLVGQDLSINNHNKQLQRAKEALDKSIKRALASQVQAAKNPGSDKYAEAVEKSLNAKTRAEAKYQDAVDTSVDAIGSGTGKVGLLLPSNRREVRES